MDLTLSVLVWSNLSWTGLIWHLRSWLNMNWPDLTRQIWPKMSGPDLSYSYQTISDLNLPVVLHQPYMTLHVLTWHVPSHPDLFLFFWLYTPSRNLLCTQTNLRNAGPFLLVEVSCRFLFLGQRENIYSQVRSASLIGVWLQCHLIA